MGRKFFSPQNSGVYISVLLRPDAMAPERALKITTMAAVAASRAIEEVTGKEAKIKWVNDIFVDGLKVVGILTEASMSMESGRLDFAVLGIGFNVYLPEGGFPEELREKIRLGSRVDIPFSRRQISGCVVGLSETPAIEEAEPAIAQLCGEI